MSLGFVFLKKAKGTKKKYKLFSKKNERAREGVRMRKCERAGKGKENWKARTKI